MSMKKIVLAVMLCIGSAPFLQAQRVVWDIACMETLIANHKVQHASFQNMKENEAQIATFNQQIAAKMVQIEAIQSKFYGSLKSIEAIIRTGKDIIYAADIVRDIVKYQSQMIELAVGDPKLIVVAVNTEAQLISRTADLMTYIYQVAIVGTDINLMDNAQRLDLLKYVIQELRFMRGLAFAVCRKMKTAKRNGIMQSLAPQFFKYRDNRAKIVEELLNNYNPQPRR